MVLSTNLSYKNCNICFFCVDWLLVGKNNRIDTMVEKIHFSEDELTKISAVFEGRALWVAGHFLYEGFVEADRIRDLKKKVLRALRDEPIPRI